MPLTIFDRLALAVQGITQPLFLRAGAAAHVWSLESINYGRWLGSWVLGSRRHRGRGVLLYHDVVSAAEGDSSGFAGPGAGLYKMTPERFTAHMKAMKASFALAPSLLRTDRDFEAPMFALSFDDGGRSAIERVAPQLEAFGWRGHFFITTDTIGKPGFLTAAEIADLYRRGHVIGSHSVSHPRIMSALSDAELHREWRDSIDVLHAITGAPIDTASVPGGYCSRRVIRAAAECGIRLLMTSEPSARVRHYAGLTLVGRYTVKGASPAREAVALAGGSRVRQWRQWLRWNSLKLAKFGLGASYPVLRDALLGVRRSKTGISNQGRSI